ncbi:hypothetical protein AAG570_007757 [Ranatra chinensis]|uniref:Uncharacterized protein n=1 Tax=Ranatra chinensis TaxID=642074 RepID=A0ABD0YD03_9HEMI
MAGELPVWVCGQQLWLKGVDTKTTCNDIILALVGRVDEGYAIIERWRGVEKPLSGLVRVWKVWCQWGDAQHEVKLTLKRVPEGCPEPPVPSRKKHFRQKAQAHTVHPKKLCHLSRAQNIEKLLKLILAQGETIQNQLKKLHERDCQIEEEAAKVSPGGRGDDPEEKENDSGVVTEPPTEENNPPGPRHEPVEALFEKRELQKKIELWEKIVKVNKKLEKEEDEASIAAELRRIQIESEKSAKELEHNSYNISKADLWINERRKHLQRLHLELEASDNETARLMRLSESLSRFKDKNPLDVDSNSDTGLSSLHSSSEEGTYILDAIL